MSTPRRLIHMSILRNKYFSETTVSDNELSQHEIRTNDPAFKSWLCNAAYVNYFAANNLQNFQLSCKSLYFKYCLRIGSHRAIAKRSTSGIALAWYCLAESFYKRKNYSIAFIVSYAFQEFEMLTLFLSRAISNRAKERSCQYCLTFTEAQSRDSFQ